MPPSLGAALGQGFRALACEPWLLPVGALVAAARRALLWPAWAVLGAVLAHAALRAALDHPLDPAAPFEGASAALGSPRLAALVLGLWLAGALLGAALRVAFLAGVLPTLGAALAGVPREPRFALGMSYRFPLVLAASALGLAAEVAAALFGWTLVAAALRVGAHAAQADGSPLLAAAAVALALTLAIAVPVAAGAFADAGVARAAIRGEGPGEAFAAAARRFLARPGTFVLAALAFGLAGALAPTAVEGFGGIATGFARGIDPLLLLGPQLMLALVAVGVAAALDLWWLGTVTALACGEAASR